MGFFSSNVSITRYQVVGQLTEPLMDNLTQKLTQNAIVDIDDEDLDQSSGWTSFEDPFTPDFSGSGFVIGSYFIFSFRMDKKIVPPKILNKYYKIEISKRLKEGEKEFISRNEKKQIKEDVLRLLMSRIPATPNSYDILWNYEKSTLWLFSTQKTANEAFEIFFTKSFKLNLIRHFPYTAAIKCLDAADMDMFNKLVPTSFME
jgi:recombination associated protein RdgC